MKISVLDKRTSCVLGSMTSMATVTLEQKRLEQLKQQLFGKSDSISFKITPKQLKNENVLKQATTGTIAFNSINLKADLVKIAILSALALSIQLFLFFANQNGLIKLFN